MIQPHEKLSIALPDGHLMNSVLPFLKGTGLTLDGYEKTNMLRRPALRPLSEEAQQRIPRPETVAVKVIRPQDMPAQVANGNFDLALSGTDWLREHKIRFPNSPVDPVPLLKLGLGKVRIVAAAHQDHGINMNDFLSGFRAFDDQVAIFRDHPKKTEVFSHCIGICLYCRRLCPVYEHKTLPGYHDLWSYGIAGPGRLRPDHRKH